MRWLRLFLLTGAAFSVYTDRLSAAPPQLRSVFPAAAQRGVETRLQLLGNQFGPGMQCLLPFAADVRLEAGNSDVAWLNLKPAKDAPPGVYPMRVRTADGVSNLMLINVSDLPVAHEVEPNGKLEQAQRLQWPGLVAGSFGGRDAPHPSRDLDLYRFSVKAGQRLTIVAETRRLGLSPDLLLRLRDPRGRELVHCDDMPGLGVDPRIDYTFTETGDYFLETHLTHFNYGGRNLTYLLKIGDFDYARSLFPLGGKRGEKFQLHVLGRDAKTSLIACQPPGDPFADEWFVPLPKHPGSLPMLLAIGEHSEIFEDPDRKAPQPVAMPLIINGQIAKPNESDRYHLTVEPGQKVRARVDAAYFGSALQGVVRAYDPAGKLIGENFHRRPRTEIDPLLDFVVPEKVRDVTIAVEDFFGRGGDNYPYRLTLEREAADFDLFLGTDVKRDIAPAQDVLHLPAGVPVALTVQVLRRGFEGDIRVDAVDAPKGVSVKPALIKAGEKAGTLLVTAVEPTVNPVFELTLIGTGENGKANIRRIVHRPLYLGEPASNNLPWNWRLDRVLCCKLPAK